MSSSFWWREKTKPVIRLLLISWSTDYSGVQCGSVNEGQHGPCRVIRGLLMQIILQHWDVAL